MCTEAKARAFRPDDKHRGDNLFIEQVKRSSPSPTPAEEVKTEATETEQPKHKKTRRRPQRAKKPSNSTIEGQ